MKWETLRGEFVPPALLPVSLETDRHAHAARLVEERQLEAACRGHLLTPAEATVALMAELAEFGRTLPDTNGDR